MITRKIMHAQTSHTPTMQKLNEKKLNECSDKLSTENADSHIGRGLV